MSIAPPRPAELLRKLLFPTKVSTTLCDVLIAPPVYAELPMKLLVSLKVSATLLYTLFVIWIAPPALPLFALSKKLLVPVK